MPIRNPFRRAGAPDQPDEAQRNTPENDFKSTTVSGATPLQLKDPAEYKLSGEIPPAMLSGDCALMLCVEINDSGVYLPVRQPLERTWHRCRPKPIAAAATVIYRGIGSPRNSPPHSTRSPRSGTPSPTSRQPRRTTAVFSARTSPLAFRAKALIRTGDHL
jgi:hypothetical protein